MVNDIVMNDIGSISVVIIKDIDIIVNDIVMINGIDIIGIDIVIILTDIANTNEIVVYS